MKDKNKEKTALAKIPVRMGISTYLENEDFQAIENTIPNEILERGNEQEIIDYATLSIASIEQNCEQVLITAAWLETNLRMREGGIFKQVKDKLGRETMLILCERLNIGQSTAYNYIDLYENRFRKEIMDMAPSKALRVIQLIRRGDVELKKDRILFHIGASTKEIGLDEVKEMSFRDFADITESYRSMERELKKQTSHMEQKQESHKKEIEKLRKNYYDLEHRYKSMLLETDQDFEELMKEAERHSENIRRILVKVFDAVDTSEAAVQLKVFDFFHELKDIVAVFGDKVEFRDRMDSADAPEVTDIM